jgi:hypothetical protein
MHHRFTESTSPDILALHEAFADIVALFQHFSYPEVLSHVIAKTRGDLSADNQLVKLAHQFGKSIGRTDALRSAIGLPPDPEALDRETEPHRRGSILVAAVFDAFLSIYRKRTEDLMRLATQGSGVLPAGAIHPDLVNRLAKTAAKSSQHVLNMCIRALDYLPPVDVTFGDYLRALITADFDLVPDDSLSYRIAFIEAFRRRGIFPRDVRSMSEESLRWEGPNLGPGGDDGRVDFSRDLVAKVQGWDLRGDREKIFDSFPDVCEIAKKIVEDSWRHITTITKGLKRDFPEFEVHSIRPVRRVGPDGQLLVDVLVEIIQSIPGYLDRTLQECPKKPSADGEPDFWFRGGCTFIIDLDSGKLRYSIYKNVDSESRYDRQRAFLSGQYAPPGLHATYFNACGHEDCDEVFSFVHRL